MDSRRPPHSHYTQPPQPAQPHPAAPPALPPPAAPHTPLDSRAPPPPPPPPPFSHPAQLPHTPQPPPHHQYAGPPPPPGAQGLALPPIQAPYAAPGAPSDQHQLPSLRHPAQYAHEPPREGADYHAYNQQNRSGHVTPAPVNRTFSHDSAHQQRTPTTPAHPSQYPPAPGLDGAAPPTPHPMDQSGYHSYPPTNGIPHGLPPPPQQHEQQHHYSPPLMENHHGYPPPQPMAYSPSYGPSSTFVSVQKRKQMRATQACEQCRQRKQKCDEGNPCSFCKEQGLNCQYRDTPPAKTDKNMEKLLSYMESHTAALEHLTGKMDDFDQRLRRVEHSGGFPGSGETPAATPLYPDDSLNRKAELEDHRTGAHKLILLWPSVKPLLQDAKVEHGESYVMEAEDRGILRIYTRGEGIDEHDGTQPGGPASPARSEDLESSAAPSPPEGLWGTGLPRTPHSEVRRSEPYCEGGLKPDGSLDLDTATINKLYDSYMKNLHRMHPFLDKSRLRKLFDRFIAKYSTGHPTLRKFAVESESDQERPLKRQRSNGAAAIGLQGHDYGQREPTERSPGNAVVFLILALGKICMHKAPLPATVPDNRPNANSVILHQLQGSNGVTGSSPISGAMRPSPISPRSTPITQPTPPSADGVQRPEHPSRRASTDTLPGARNLDIIPGLAYYAKAAEILGDQGDGNDLVHAQMFLLAGLYKGQLARVKESMSWISMAGRAIMTLLDRYKLYNEHYWSAHGDTRKQYEKAQARIKDKRHNLIVLASWTCLQLESDILAELRLPSSGILTIEDMLLHPHHMPYEEKETYEDIQQNYPDSNGDDKDSFSVVLFFYSAQTFLRKRLNRMHKEMYGDQSLNQTIEQVRAMLSGHGDTLTVWRDLLPAALRWNDDDPPPSDILEARLRAKYWGARYVSCRAFLDYALHIMPHMKEGREIESVARDVHGNPRNPAEVHLFKAIATMGEQEIWQATKRCIDAAMHSTEAFDGVEDRLIVTNIHGTAHAQFGNMLVLAATYYNNWLKQLVPEKEFQRLLERTIKFLRRLAPISPTCANDCQILEKINKLLFGNVPPEAKEMYRNEFEPPSHPASASTSFNRGT